ncbi:two-component system response regulator CreB [Entomomonas sp. E2T0]|uniref:two-component system response regulator CreB n=1 Tax=Entomomonas sp. E2T0 TaxID=2930213 RepID=UPI00222828C9|nr:two-component system response regulator CreB [Entomomonas sp. E2T0]UYZ85026.1 two-component system response regulator CreB [Entomomonas sp. E2T0]
MPHILIIEDEAAIADTLLYALQSEGFECTWLTLGNKALEQHKQTPADLWILDVGLPDLNGFEVCRQLRRFSEVPVIFLTARDSEIDRVVGLEIGADDYVVKPFSPREVAARVRAILKRTTNTSQKTNSPTTDDKLFSVDESAYTIYLQQQPINLTRHEFNLFRYLLSQPKRVFSREQLLDALGIAVDAGYERNIDSHIKTLRAKIREIDSNLDVIRTHRGFGYSYDPN